MSLSYCGNMGAVEVILAVLCLTATAAVKAEPWVPEAKNNVSWWVEKHEEFKRITAQDRDSINIIFYGDSITDFWRDQGRSTWDTKYAHLGAVNYGIKGDRTQHLLYRIMDGETDGLNPQLVVLMIGTNNGRDTIDDTVIGIRAVLDLLLKRFPQAKILFLGNIPRDDAGWFARTVEVNIKISKFHDGGRVHFLDMFNQFAATWGQVNSTLYAQDELHLSPQGFQVWADTMDPLFKKLLYGSCL